MRKEYLFFFIMLGVAAMITGFTVGFIANYAYIEQSIQKQQAVVHESKSSHTVDVKDETTDGTENHPSILEANAHSTDTNVSTETTASTIVIQPMLDGTQIDVPLSPTDMQSVNAMLDELNVADATTDAERIRNFQQQSGLEESGVLDTSTLSAIIQEVALKHAQRNLYGG